MTSVLTPLAARYAHWLGLPVAAVHDTTDEDPGTVRAMQVVLRVEKTAPPRRTPLLEAAAAAAVAVCLDPRADPAPRPLDGPGGPGPGSGTGTGTGPGGGGRDGTDGAEGAAGPGGARGEWADDVAAWLDGRIRKVSRRARGAHWTAVEALPGVTVEVDGAQVRALVPGRVAALPPEVRRLQVAGTDLEPDEPGPPRPGTPVLWTNPAVPMTVGKAAAQVGHATMIAAALLGDGTPAERAALAAWAESGFAVSVRAADAARWSALLPGPDPARAWRDDRVVAVRDAGFTEVAPGTVTVLADVRALG